MASSLPLNLNELIIVAKKNAANQPKKISIAIAAGILRLYNLSMNNILYKIDIIFIKVYHVAQLDIINVSTIII